MVLFGEMRHFLQLFAEKLTKTPKQDSLLEKLQVLAKSTIFREMRHFLQLFAEIFTKTPEHDILHRKVEKFGEIDDFLWFFAK